MPVKRNSAKHNASEKTIEEVISKGAKTLADDIKETDQDKRLTLRIPPQMFKGIEQAIARRQDKPSYNQFILEAIRVFNEKE